ncbi:hypothetical protein PBI_SCTP2_110 [Salicola phage SCTP-2]|nr:hypothetical protein PBI_SCTP2_110 [Salicola phage SCTP-2]
MINEAIKKASELPYISNQTRLYAIVTDKKGRVIAEGANSYTKTHPIQFHYAQKVNREEAIFLHAEMNAIIRCVRSSNRCKPYAIYVARVTHNNEPAMAKPCEICEEAIKEAGIKRVYYTTFDSSF